jgi:hypothetical protein
MSDSLLKFVPFGRPDGRQAWVPADVELALPQQSALPLELQHFLIYIPWRDKYTQSVPPAYLNFFNTALPYMSARTTNVHVAVCLPFIAQLRAVLPGPVDLAVVTTAFILHDTGWSQMSEQEIAASLGVQGLALSGAAVNPKARHAVLGKAVAEKVLADYEFDPPLSEDQKALIYEAILFHDKPWELAGENGIPESVKLVCDVDHLWSFTHENFWQDTVRKGVRPDVYAANLANNLPDYFVTEAGHQRARALLAERQQEVAAWAEQPPL